MQSVCRRNIPGEIFDLAGKRRGNDDASMNKERQKLGCKSPLNIPHKGIIFAPRLSCFGFLLFLLVSLVQPPRAVGQKSFPYETSSEVDLPLLGSGAALFGLGYWADARGPDNRPHTLEEIQALSPNLVNGFDRSATSRWSASAAKWSDIFMYSSAVAPLSLSLTGVGSKEPLTLTAMHLETLFLNGGATYLLKNLFRRTRPFVYNRDPDVPDSLKMSRTARRSFPSGHTSTAFASLVFLATVYGKMYPDSDSRSWVWAGCLTTAGVTGYLRYAAGFHYPSDILAGAALGAFVGWLVPQLHEVSTDVPGGGTSKSHMFIGLRMNF
jgi:membrane-associated phospholipid phosphatase